MSGRIVGSYVDAGGIYHPYMRQLNGRFISLDLPQAAMFEYFFVHGINDAGALVGRSKRIGNVVRTSVGSLQHGLRPLVFPGSVSTEGWNINQDHSVVGYYDTADGRRHGFIARLSTKEDSERYANIFNLKLSKGLNMVSLPLATPKPINARAFAGLTGSTMVIALDADNQRFIGWTPDSPDNGFEIEGGQGYIVNVASDRDVAFVGAEWRNETAAAAAPSVTPLPTQQQTWAFIVSGHLDGKQKYDGYHITVRNLRTRNVMTTQVQDNYFAAATADLSYRSVVQVGDTMQVIVTDSKGNIASDEFTFEVTPASVSEAFLSVTLDSIGTPKHSQLLQNYPNPFNPETWIPYRLSEDSNVSITIYDATGSVVQTLSLGFQSVGFYQDRGRAAYWDGKNASGEKVASGLYFYQLTTKSFNQTRRLIILK
ncbi:T9SS type A sorting domain-containing protein [Candidatus Poribacteria bacterium]|nr:T9SS type A sorting domain-containing protein [Candidatus Poribacteria bacterium]